MVAGFGAFGKIPSLGDFFRLDLPRNFVEPWDTWLQGGIMSSRNILGEDWNSRYMTAPIWRFSLPANQAGLQAISGVLVPSVDRVGRQFPLTLAAPSGVEITTVHHFSNTAVFEQLEDLALQALDDSMTLDKLRSGLAEMAFAPDSTLKVDARPDCITWQSDRSPIPLLAAQCTGDQIMDSGLWSMALSGDHRVMACKNLPNSAEITGLFDLNAPIWTALPPVPVA
jgi:type VI secretion system protein ImpM